MLGGRNRKDGSLDSGSINLLPDELRVVEEKDKRAKRRREEAPYQLRAPKKQKRRRRMFSWLPVFGGAHWRIEHQTEVKKEQETEGIAEHVAVDIRETPTEAPAYDQSMTDTGGEAPLIRPVFEQHKKVSVGSPEARRSVKRGFSFLSFGNFFSTWSKRPPTIPSPHIPHHEAPAPRHYSLLEPSETLGPKRSEMPVAVPTISSVRHETARPILPQPISDEAVQQAPRREPRRTGRGWPWWLDIFSLIASLSPTRSGRRAHKPRLVPTSREAFSEIPERTRPQTPSHLSLPKFQRSAERLSRVHTALLTTGVPSESDPSVEMQHKKGGMRLPKWLDIFFWLRKVSVPERHHVKRQAPDIRPQGIFPIPQGSDRAIHPVQPTEAMPHVSARVQGNVPQTPIFGPHGAGGPKYPHPKEKKAPRRWNMPKWLDIFYWLTWLKGPAKIVREVQRTPVPTPMPHVPMPALPRVEERVREVPVPPKAPAPPMTPSRFAADTRPALRPEQQIAPERRMPEPTGLHVAGLTPAVAPVPPKAPPRRSDGIVPIADVSDIHNEKSKKQQEDLRKFFHIPTKTHFPDETRAAREVNLIPGDLTARSWKKLGQLLGIACMGTLVFVAIIYSILYFWKSQIETRTAIIDNEIQKFKNDILVYRSQEPEMTAIGG